MVRLFLLITAAVVVLHSLAGTAPAQIDDVCTSAGITPSLDGLSPRHEFQHIPYVYGRIVLKGSESVTKQPKVTVTLTDSGQQPVRWAVDKSGNYCFKRGSGGGLLRVEVDGIEAARREIPATAGSQQREDFEIYPDGPQRSAPPSTVSAKFTHERTSKTAELYRKAAEAQKSKDNAGAISYLKELLASDPADFIAWAQLASAYFRQSSYPDAEAAYRRSLELRVDYTPAWIAVGQLRIAQKQFDTAAEIFKHALEIEPDVAMTYRLLGEAYLQGRKGTLGAEALNKAISLDPVGMAECHLELGHLYELAGAKDLAAKEYKLFLSKVPDHADRKRLEKYIKDNQ